MLESLSVRTPTDQVWMAGFGNREFLLEPHCGALEVLKYLFSIRESRIENGL